MNNIKLREVIRFHVLTSFIPHVLEPFLYVNIILYLLHVTTDRTFVYVVIVVTCKNYEGLTWSVVSRISTYIVLGGKNPGR